MREIMFRPSPLTDSLQDFLDLRCSNFCNYTKIKPNQINNLLNLIIDICNSTEEVINIIRKMPYYYIDKNGNRIPLFYGEVRLDTDKKQWIILI